MLVALEVLALLLSYSLSSLSQYLPVLSAGRAALAKLQDDLDDAGAVLDEFDASRLAVVRGEILFSDVKVRGDDDAPILARVAARTGIRTVTQSSLLAQIGMVQQDSVVFSLTLRGNIRLGRADTSEEALAHAAKSAGLFDLIAAMPRGFDTLVGTGGVELTNATLQRLAIARALIRNPAILILDGATDPLSQAEEAGILTTVRQVMPARLRRIPVFAGQSDTALAELAFYFATETIPAGREILRQGEPEDKLYILVRSKLEASHPERERPMALQDGDYFGENALLAAGAPAMATITSLTVCTGITLERCHYQQPAPLASALAASA